MKREQQAKRPRRGWDDLATWYDGWVGQRGSDHHRQLAIPTLLELLELRPGERLLDIGCGQGALASAVIESKAIYMGVDVSERMLQQARRRHGAAASFVKADATKLSGAHGLAGASFDAVAFLLSIQNIDPIGPVLAGAAWALKPGGRVVILMTHPCFRVPRQSGWGWDARRRLSYRRIDRYLGRLAVPLKPLPNRPPVISFHRPLEDYFTALGESGFVVETLREVAMADPEPVKGPGVNPDIPLFLGLRARLAQHGP